MPVAVAQDDKPVHGFRIIENPVLHIVYPLHRVHNIIVDEACCNVEVEAT
jgi:hypothetical protein